MFFCGGWDKLYECAVTGELGCVCACVSACVRRRCALIGVLVCVCVCPCAADWFTHPPPSPHQTTTKTRPLAHRSPFLLISPRCHFCFIRVFCFWTLLDASLDHVAIFSQWQRKTVLCIFLSHRENYSSPGTSLVSCLFSGVTKFSVLRMLNGWKTSTSTEKTL